MTQGRNPFICVGITLVFLFLAGIIPTMGAEIYVSPEGKDSHSGTKAEPVNTLAAAREAVRKLKAQSPEGKEPISVILREGVYSLGEPFELTEADSGTSETPIIYQAQDGEKVILTGGKSFDISEFEAVSDPVILEKLPEGARGHVRQLNLKKHNLTDFREYPESFRDFSPLEVFYADRPMTPARWPNEGWASFPNEDVVEPGKTAYEEPPAGIPGVFTYRNERMRRWKAADSLILYGYFAYDWADEGRKVLAMDFENQQLTVARGQAYNLGKGNSTPRRFFAFNLIEELDMPGEWYLDRGTGILYFWPPEGPSDGKVTIPVLDGPLVSMKGVHDVQWKGIFFEATVKNGVEIHDSHRVVLTGCTLRNITGLAVIIVGGWDNGVTDSDIYHCGIGGIVLKGGDRNTLTPGNHTAKNNHIYDFSRLKKTYSPAVLLDGVGQLAANNLIHDAPHSAFLYWGNDHVMEYNEIHHVGLETADAGAIYTGRDWTFRGNVVRYNFIHHNGVKFAPPVQDLEGIVKEFALKDSMGVHGVYLDDCHSSTTIHGNVIHGANFGAFIGGGRDTIITNNIMVECENAIALDARGIGWASKMIQLGGDMDLYTRLQAVPYQTPPWSTRYPELAVILKYAPPVPIGNIVRDNVCFRCGKSIERIGEWMDDFSQIGAYFETADDPGFASAAENNFQLKPDSVVYTKLPDFKPIPFEKIGLQRIAP